MMAKKSARPGLGRAAAKAGEVAAAVASGGASLLAVPSALLGVVAEVGDVIRDENDRRIAELLREAFFENGSDEGIAAYIRGLLQQPAFRRVLREAVRAKLESLASDDVTPALGVLLREYELGREPDWFFRGACRVLQDLSPEEFAELLRMACALVDALEKVPEKTTSLMVNLHPSMKRLEAVVPQGYTNVYHPLAEFAAGPHATRLVRLLTAQGFGTVSDRDGELSWRVECSVLVRLRNVLQPPMTRRVRETP